VNKKNKGVSNLIATMWLVELMYQIFTSWMVKDLWSQKMSFLQNLFRALEDVI